MRRFIASLLVGSAFLAVTPSARADFFRVQVRDSFFLPVELNILAFDAVTWAWLGTMLPHSTTADDGAWDSGLHTGTFTYRRVFAQPGDYPYYCSIHGFPGGVGMSGIIHVATRDHDDDDE